jgi:ABC-type polysaccharide/polyol phosphate transport system ATPase subunit
VGPNGSGKSTLLRLVAGILQPSAGRVRICGRVAPLIELGAGFHPELTGRENAFLNAALFGLTRREIQAIYEPVVAFAELWDFMDVPVKSYSLGMQMRLGFAVAVHVHADILLVDEVLAVGDEDFQAKCHARLAQLRGAGTAMVLVSHDGAALERFCERALLLDEGRVVAAGPTAEVLGPYHRLSPQLGLLTRPWPGAFACTSRASTGATPGSARSSWPRAWRSASRSSTSSRSGCGGRGCATWRASSAAARPAARMERSRAWPATPAARTCPGPASTGSNGGTAAAWPAPCAAGSATPA